MKNKVERRFSPVVRQVVTEGTDESTASGASCELRAAGDDAAAKKQIVGYSAVFGVDTKIDTYFGNFSERIQKGAFRRAIREGQDVRALFNHDANFVLGRTTSKTLRLREDDTGLYIEVDPPNNSIGNDVSESISRGDISGQSFAFIVRKEKWVMGADGTPDQRIIQDVDLYDVGPVTYPAYGQTSADMRSASHTYQIGLAELGKQVPPMPEETREPVRSLDTSTSDSSESDAAASDSRSLETEVQTTEAPPATFSGEDASLAFRNRLRLSRNEAERNLFRISVLTK